MFGQLLNDSQDVSANKEKLVRACHLPYEIGSTTSLSSLKMNIGFKAFDWLASIRVAFVYLTLIGFRSYACLYRAA